MSSKSKKDSKSDYLQPLLPITHYSSRSPLELLEETCSNIGSDSHSSPALITISPVKSISSTKSPTSSQLKSSTPRKTTLPLIAQTVSKSLSFTEPNLLSNSYPPLFDPRASLPALLFHSSLAYFSSQPYSYPRACVIPQCSQCGDMLSNSISDQPYVCHEARCSARFGSSEELLEHDRYIHKTSKVSRDHRYHPYSKSSRPININDQLPYFHPQLPLPLMTETIPPWYYNHRSLY